MKNYKYILRLLAAITLILGIQSCHDDLDLSKVMDENPSDIPEEMKEGFTISFVMTLDPMGGEDNSLTRALSSNSDLRDIEDYVDMEKLRILFFTCLDDEDGVDAMGNKYKEGESQGPRYESGKHDIFLFESRSRWVSQLSDAESTADRWLVTAPVYTYGNNDVYQWDMIREALTTRPFKIAILANRPDKVDFGDFDGKFNKEVTFDTDRGPDWGVTESDKGIEDYKDAKAKGFKNLDGQNWTMTGVSINGLHHCQWDPIYTSKNNGFGGYNYIMEKPYPEEPYTKDTGPFLKVQEGVGTYNMMGALSYWTKKEGGLNYYFHPNYQQAIPMYGVQKFNKIENWKEGTPINISDRVEGQVGNTNRKSISLLRSLVRLDLLIPTTVATTVTDVNLKYSNVMSRCEPLDVATPTELLWDAEHGTLDKPESQNCEWWDLYSYGPIINQNYGNNSNSTYVKQQTDAQLKESYLKRTAWFYGAWKTWWNFRESEKDWKDSYLTDENENKGLPYPRIFNGVIQRNGDAYLRDVEILDPGYHHFVVYTGERNINDPSKFENLDLDKSEVAYFYFKADGKEYCLALTDYKKNTTIRNSYLGNNSNLNNYRTDMVQKANNNRENWNWPLLRNHIYTFTVTSIGSKEDNGGFDVLTISAEERHAPTIKYY